MAYIDRTRRIPKFGGHIYYVSKTYGDDSNTGLSPETDYVLETIGAAIGKLSSGDAISVAAGTYTETGLDLDVNNCEIWFEIGAILQPASGVPLTISGNYCYVGCQDGALRINPQAAVTGLEVTGNFVYLEEIRIASNSTGTIGFDIQGDGANLCGCRCSSPLTAAFKIQGDKVRLFQCCTGGEVANTSIGFWVTNSCDKTRLDECGSQGHSTAGFQFDDGCTNICVKDSFSGGGDGHFIDNASLTSLHLEDRDSREQHEHIYPTPDGEGTSGSPILVSSEITDETGADNAQNYFGDSYVIMPVNTRTVDWFFKGVDFFAETALDNQYFRFYRVVYDSLASKDGGNDWDEGATVLTVDDASEIESGDLVWITSDYKTNGEIVEVTDVTGDVVTISRQTENSGRTGLHWDHTTNNPGTEKLYLCWRDEKRYHSTDLSYSAESTKSFTSQSFVKDRRLHVGDGLVVRLINATDGQETECGIGIRWSE